MYVVKNKLILGMVQYRWDLYIPKYLGIYFNTDGQRAAVWIISELISFAWKSAGYSNIFKTTPRLLSYTRQTVEWQVFAATQLKGHPAVT